MARFPCMCRHINTIYIRRCFPFCGHDGSAIAWPQLPDPLSRVGFHYQEMCSYCLSVNYAFIHIGRGFYTTRENVNTYVSFDSERQEKRFLQYMRNYCDILNTSEELRVWDGLKMWNVIMNQPEEYIN